MASTIELFDHAKVVQQKCTRQMRCILDNTNSSGIDLRLHLQLEGSCLCVMAQLRHRNRAEQLS